MVSELEAKGLTKDRLKMENTQTQTRESQGRQEKVAAEQNMAQTTKQADIEAIKESIMVVREADNSVKSTRPIHIISRSGGIVLWQQALDLKAANKVLGNV